MEFTVTERFYRTYKIEAESFEEAKAIAENEFFDGDEVLDGIAYIRDENGKEQIYS